MLYFIICCRGTPLSAQSSLSQITKRRLEFGVDVETFRLQDRRLLHSDASMEEEDVFAKRRRRLLDDERHEIESRRRPFPMLRPQVMRQINNEDENLIRETQVALKSLSGNWVRNQSPPVSSEDNDDGNAFENLFDDKRSDKMLPSSPSQSSESTSQKSFGYNDDHRANDPLVNGINVNDGKRRSDEDKNEYDRHSKYSHYDGTNFNELGDSSNELEIDCDDDESDYTYKRKPEMSAVNKQSLFNAYKAATAALPYSTQSAFKPPAEVKHRLHNPSFPSEPFGGYSNDHEKSSVNKGSKQYTVLQPAGVGSRAATALQEARAVPTAQPARETRPQATFSPTNSRGTSPGHVHLKQR